MPQEIIGIQVQGHVIIRHGTSQIVKVDTGQGTVKIVVHVIGAQVDGLPQSIVGIAPLLSGKRHGRPRSPSVSVIGVYLQALVQPFLCGKGVLLAQIDFRLQGIGVGELSPLRDNGVQLHLGGIIVAALHQAQRPVVPIILVARLQANGFIIIGYRLVISFLPNLADSAQVINVIDIGIEPDSLCGVILRALEVIEIVFGDTAVIPRLVKVRLGGDGQVKILDGQHEVIIIEGTATCRYQPVHPVLRFYRGEREKQQHEESEPFHANPITLMRKPYPILPP